MHQRQRSIIKPDSRGTSRAMTIKSESDENRFRDL
jgi:hypothetical protein